MNRRVMEVVLVEARKELHRALDAFRRGKHELAARRCTDAIGRAEAARDLLAQQAALDTATTGTCDQCHTVHPSGHLVVYAGSVWCPVCHAARCSSPAEV